MKRLFSIALLFTLLICGCKQDESLKEEVTLLDLPIVTADFEQNKSRTYIEEGNLLRWTKNDQISFFFKYTFNFQYQFDGNTGDNAGTFSPVKQVVATGMELQRNYAIYPFSSNTKITENGVITSILPSEQNYVPNSFGLGDNTMVAATEDIDDTFLKFKNVGGYLKLLLYGDDVTVKTITLQGNSNEKLAGTATITPFYNGDPTIAMADDATKVITLDCGENGVEIGSTAETATAFWIVVPPTTFEDGFTITVTDVNGGKFEKKTSNEVAVKRNVIKPMSAFKVEPQTQTDEIPYLTFSADAEQSLKMSEAVETLEYSVNGGEWKELGTNAIYFGGDKGELQIRGKSSFGTAKNNSYYSQISFGNETFVACSGDIRTLFDYENFETVNTGNARFCRLFNNCSSLIKAPELPAEDLADYCYVEMFQFCNNLMQAPELPATILSKWCYTNMFDGCSKLIKASELPAVNLTEYCYAGMYSCTNLTESPKLPAINLAQNCYNSMYAGCKNLTKSPELPATIMFDRCYMGMFSDCISLTESSELSATKLAKWCYSDMFAGCTNLKTSSLLPANALAEGCYYNMFRNCISLIQAPELPATILSDYCYYGMFYGCNNLNFITMLATDISASYCLYGWTEGVASTGTFIKAKEMESLPNGTSGIPDGWIIINYGKVEDDTPYVTFAADAVQTLAMSKSVETLEYSVNNGNWTELGTNTITFGGNHGSLRLRAKNNIGTATSPSENSYATITFGNDNKVSCNGDIRTLIDYENYTSINTSNARFCYLFYNCAQLTSAPSLPITNLATQCYKYMFRGCTNLTKAPELPATTMRSESYGGMFWGCASLAKAPELPATELAGWCYYYMFYGCTSLTIAPALPVTNLKEYCYHSMFEGCTNLTIAPQLPATTLSDYCYAYMFHGCENLTTAPTLPATTLVEGCYWNMFSNCSKLNNITMLATSIDASYSLNDWTKDVASSGIFYKAKDMESLPTGFNGIPNDWLVVNYDE